MKFSDTLDLYEKMKCVYSHCDRNLVLQYDSFAKLSLGEDSIIESCIILTPALEHTLAKCLRISWGLSGIFMLWFYFLPYSCYPKLANKYDKFTSSSLSILFFSFPLSFPSFSSFLQPNYIEITFSILVTLFCLATWIKAN